MSRETADLATRIGPRRGLIGLAVIAVAVGGSIILVRYLRARNAEYPLEMEENVAGDGGRRTRSRKRSQAQQADSRAPY